MKYQENILIGYNPLAHYLIKVNLYFLFTIVNIGSVRVKLFASEGIMLKYEHDIVRKFPLFAGDARWVQQVMGLASCNRGRHQCDMYRFA